MNDRDFLSSSVILALIAASAAHAQELGKPGPDPTGADAAVVQLGDETPPITEDDALHVSVAPYAWLTSINGDISVRGITINADVDFAEVIDASDSVIGLMGAVDLEYKGFVGQINGAWNQIEFTGSRAFARNGTLSADVTMDSAWVEALGGYRFLERSLEPGDTSRRRATLDGFVGARFTMIDVEASFTASESVTLPDGEVITAGQTANRGQSETWVEPFIGARLGLDLSDHWQMILRGDVGGFGVAGSDFSWHVAALVGYRWDLEGWSIGLFGGYRALGQDYSEDDFAWDAVTHGPMLGVHFGWEF